MRSCPLTPNIKEMVEFLPVVHQQLNRALMHDFGIPDIPLNDETAWGITSRPAGAEG